jgi:hypothetical protein
VQIPHRTIEAGLLIRTQHNQPDGGIRNGRDG